MAKQFCSAFCQSFNITIASELFRNKANSSRLPLAREERAHSSHQVIIGWEDLAGKIFSQSQRKEKKIQIIVDKPAPTEIPPNYSNSTRRTTFHIYWLCLVMTWNTSNSRTILAILIKQQISRSPIRMQTRTNFHHSILNRYWTKLQLNLFTMATFRGKESGRCREFTVSGGSTILLSLTFCLGTWGWSAQGSSASRV